MKKFVFYLATLAAIAVGCTSEPVPSQGSHGKTFTVTASMPSATKTTINDSGKLAWETGDQIEIYDGDFEALTLVGEAGDQVATFSGEVYYPENAAIALYPAGIGDDYEDGVLIVKLPGEYEYNGKSIHAPMIGTNLRFNDNDPDAGIYDARVSFKHIGGLFRVTYENVPGNAAGFLFKASKQISGEFMIDDCSVENVALEVGEATGKDCEVTYDIPEDHPSTMSFYVPVPTGTFGFEISLYNGEGEDIEGSVKKKNSVTIARGDYFMLPAITLEPQSDLTETHTIEWVDSSDWNDVNNKDSDEISLKSNPYGYSVVAVKANSGTKPTVVDSADPKDCRVYAEGTLTVSNDSHEIVRLVFNISEQGKKRLAEISANVGTISYSSDYSQVIWEGQASSVTFTVGAKAVYGTDGASKAGQFDFNSIDATYIVATSEVVPVTGVSLNKVELSLVIGDEETLEATISPSNATNKNVAWESSNSAVATVSNGRVEAVAEGHAIITVVTEDGPHSAQCEVTVSAPEVPTLTTMDQIFAKATEVGATATNVNITFNNWVVSGVKNNNAYVTDGTKGFIIYTQSHGFVVGDILSGTAQCSVQLFKGASEITSLSTKTNGLTVTKGGVVTPQSASIASLSGVNTGAVFSFTDLTFDGTVLKDASNAEIKPFNSLYSYDSFISDRVYNVTGVYLQYDDTKEILPRNTDDIELISTVTHKVTFWANGTAISTNNEVVEGSNISFPSTNPTGANGKVFVGWSESTISGTTDTAPTFITSKVMGASDVDIYAVYATASSGSGPAQTLQYDSWEYYGGENKTTYRLFANGDAVYSAAFDLSTLTKVVVFGGTFGGDKYNSLAIEDTDGNLWKAVAVSGNSQTGRNEFAGGNSLSGTKQLKIRSTCGSGSSNGVRISKIEIYTTGSGSTAYSGYCTTIPTGGSTGGDVTPDPPVAGGTYEIVFKTNTSDGTTTIAANTNIDNVVSSGKDYITFVGTTANNKAYYSSKEGVKLGTGSAGGTLEFKLKSPANTNVTSITVYTTKYTTEASSLTMIVDGSTVESSIAAGDSYTYTCYAKSIETLRFTSTKREYVSKVVVTTGSSN